MSGYLSLGHTTAVKYDETYIGGALVLTPLERGGVVCPGSSYHSEKGWRPLKQDYCTASDNHFREVEQLWSKSLVDFLFTFPNMAWLYLFSIISESVDVCDINSRD